MNSVHAVAHDHPSSRIEARPERRYWLRTEGFDGHEVRATSGGKARWRSFVSYEDAGYGRYSWDHSTQSARFKRFLERTVCLALGAVADGAPSRHAGPSHPAAMKQEPGASS